MDEKFADIARQMAELSPKIRVELVPGAGHNVHLESTYVYTQLLREASELEG